jgi:hypothetical protein
MADDNRPFLPAGFLDVSTVRETYVLFLEKLKGNMQGKRLSDPTYPLSGFSGELRG